MLQKIFSFFSLILICGLFLNGSTMANNDIDNSIYSLLLKKHVNGGRVNYNGFKKDEKLLDEYLSILSKTDAKTLSKNRRFAFYINVYNAFTIKLILTKFPGVNSIKEIGGFFSNPWSKKFILLQGKSVSLDHIEHDILRPEFKDPRVHFAINCASKSCPPLLNEPFKGSILDSQLDDQAKKFINDSKNTYFKGDTLFISKIFKWFKDDFSNNPMIFIKQYASTELKEKLDLQKDSITLRYMDYDWSLNR
jgi:hypothetical protein